MPDFTCYRLHNALHGRVPEDLDDFIDIEDHSPTVYGPVDQGDFVAKLYVNVGPQHPPSWAAFLQDGFQAAPDRTVAESDDAVIFLPMISSVGAAVVLRLVPEGDVFAFTFGVTGRFLLKHEAWQRGYGLQTTLNLIYPRGGSAGRLVAVDAKRRGEEIVRSRQQASRATKFETFDVDKIRDLVGGATGEPHDRKWGKRISGTDPLSFAAESTFSGLGKLCRDVAEAHDRDDYKERFEWLESIRPIHDPEQLEQIQAHLVQQLLAGNVTNLDLAPPEIVEWSKVAGFRYHYDSYKKFTRPELQLTVYLTNLNYFEEDHDDSIDAEYFRHKSIRALDADGSEVHRWSVWRCLTGEFEVDGTTYVIDEGEIFEVSSDYLARLNENVSNIRLQEDIAWPAATVDTKEDLFNKDAAAALALTRSTRAGRFGQTP